AEIGLTGASPSNLVYVEGKPDHKINNDNLVDELEAMVRDRVAKKQAALKDIIATD
ncbi:MAG: (E)-4-hydroxy-3-methylbut-2-enyl-diphosphate synthase, partial [Pseudohongiellaceae bacterium]